MNLSVTLRRLLLEWHTASVYPLCTTRGNRMRAKRRTEQIAADSTIPSSHLYSPAPQLHPHSWPAATLTEKRRHPGSFVPRGGLGGSRQAHGRSATFSRSQQEPSRSRNRPRRDVGLKSAGASACQLTLAENDRRTLDQNTHETPFHGDDGSTFTLSWVGDGTGVILVLSTFGIVYEGGSSRLYRSVDYGKTFHDISNVINNTFIQKDFGIGTGPVTSNQVILTVDVPVTDVPGGIVFTSMDAGESFKQIQLPFHPSQSFTFHLQDPNCLLVVGNDAALWLSVDFAEHWTKIHEGVHSFMWGPGVTLFFSASLEGTVDAGRRGELLLKRTTDLGKTFTTVHESIFSFGYIGGFLFTSVMEKLGEPRVIYVSSNRGETFKKAELPSATKEQFYSVLDGDEDMIFMHVDDLGDTNFGTVYTSDGQGVIYSKSLERHLFGVEGKSDFTNVTSLRGVYLTNILEKDGHIRTVISFNKGGEWSLLAKPGNANCGQGVKNCNLHIHVEYSHSRGMAPMLPLSEATALGIIIAHGSLGDSITSSQVDVFVSSDGGYSWTRALRGPHHYAILDSGGLLVAIPANKEHLISTVKFSTDEGQCWQSYTFTEQPIYLAGLTSEPGTKTLNISIWGYRTEEDFKTTWVAITIDFEHLLTRECGDEDYERWLAHSSIRQDSDTRGCILGFRETFRRLKKMAVCRNGRDYVVSREQTPCNCTEEDYLCDYGYFRHENTSECVEEPIFRNQSMSVCQTGDDREIQTSGYRKVPGDRCEGGFNPPPRPSSASRRCGSGPSSGYETIMLTMVCVGVAVIVLTVSLFFIMKKLFCVERTPAYRFSALQLQDDDACVVINPQNASTGNGGIYPSDSDEVSASFKRQSCSCICMQNSM
nr:sortilin-like isoform X1 [Paramormyrops kingsleyae]